LRLRRRTNVSVYIDQYWHEKKTTKIRHSILYKNWIQSGVL